MTENDLTAIEQRVEGWSRYSPDDDASAVADDLRALLLEVRRLSPIVAAAMTYESVLNEGSQFKDSAEMAKSALRDACRKAREEQG